MSIEKNGRRFGSTDVDLQRNLLKVKFGASGVSATARVLASSRYLTIELTKVSDSSVSALQLTSLPLLLTKHISHSLSSARDDEYSAAVIPLNLETLSEPAQRVGSALLTAQADARVRLEGTKIAVLGCATKDLLDHIEQIEIENGLPHPTIGGVWARKSPEQKRSYLLVDISEAKAEAVIAYAKTGGFGYIVVYDSVWTSSHGTFPVNRSTFPNGEDGLKEVSSKIHSAGLKFGMHNLDMLISKTDPLVHPIPAIGFKMYPDNRRILARPISSSDNFIPTITTPLGLLAKGDKSRFHGRDLRLGNEIIVYDDLKVTEPYGFVGCQRGAYGTVAAEHPAGAVIDNFSEFIGYYRPDVKTDLYDRVARAEASALERFEFDYIYPDGIGENLGYWPEQPLWYIQNLLVSKLYLFTRREVMFAHAPISDYSWHIFSRGNTTDFVQTGIIKHFDLVSLSGVAQSLADLQPFEFGWLGYFDHQLDSDATRPREIEYAWSKALAYGAAMSLETTTAALEGNGRSDEILSLMKHWEQLKLSNYFPERIREQLKLPGREFSLELSSNGRWKVMPITYEPERYLARLDGKRNVWDLYNTYDNQPLRGTIEVKPSLAAFGESQNISLLEPGALKLNMSGGGPLGSQARQSQGLEFRLAKSSERSPTGSETFEAVALNKGANPAGWGCAEVVLAASKDLSNHRAVGTWVHGDASGAYLHFTLEDSSRWSVRDYYVHLDFEGWRYIQLPGPAQGEVYEFAFPFSNYWAIRNFTFADVTRLYVFISNVPAGRNSKALFGPVEALREINRFVQNPTLRINGEAITFPVRLEAGWYLEFKGGTKARLFDSNGVTKADVTAVGSVPEIRHGRNQITFNCDRVPGSGEASSITLVTRGSPLH